MMDREKIFRLSLADLIRKLMLGWLLAATLEFLLLPGTLQSLTGLKGLAQMSLLRVLVILCLTAAALTAVGRFFDIARWERIAMPILFGILAVVTLRKSWSAAFLAVCCLIEVILTVYSILGWNRNAVKHPAGNSRKWCLWVTAGFAGAFFLAVSVWTVCRVWSFCTPTYDFGIFSQMFYNMKEHLIPNTTVERDGLLSHFSVHMSPIYYLMLPFFWIVPVPATLQVLQAAVMASAVIPLWKIGRLHGLPDFHTMLACILFLLCPALAGGAGYDIHENCFLAPLVLWLLYGIDSKHWLVAGIAGLLTLMVKEDAAVYVAVIALWALVDGGLHFETFGKKQLTLGGALLAGALVWFLGATGYLANVGDGVMTYRYDNFIYDGSKSLLTVIKAVILSPMKLVFECVDTEKLQYIALTLLPLLGLPLITRKYQRYILLIPYILINLMSDYRYQHDIFFQYGFGSLACLMYLAIVNLADMETEKLRLGILAAAVMVAGTGFFTQIAPRISYYPKLCITYQAHYDSVRETLSQIPERASVSATTFYTTFLSQREDLYDIRYASREHILSTEYVVVKHGSDGDYKHFGGEKKLISLLKAQGYRAEIQLKGVMTVYHRINP